MHPLSGCSTPSRLQRTPAAIGLHPEAVAAFSQFGQAARRMARAGPIMHPIAAATG